MYSPETFFALWIDECKVFQDLIIQLWSQKDKYKEIILNQDNSIVKRIATKLNLKYKREYYFSDGLLYSEEDICLYSNSNNLILKGIKIAFEHEEHPKKIYEEIAHFLIKNSELSVIVTYIHNEDIEELIEMCERMINHPRVLKDFNLLIIFGSKSKANIAEWTGYKFVNGKFKIL